MDKLKELARRRKEAHAGLIKLNSRICRAFLEMEKATYSDGAISKKLK